MRMLVGTLSNIVGAIILIAIVVLPRFLIAVDVIAIAYIWAAVFDRTSARELKVHLTPPMAMFGTCSQNLATAT